MRVKYDWTEADNAFDEQLDDLKRRHAKQMRKYERSLDPTLPKLGRPRKYIPLEPVPPRDPKGDPAKFGTPLKGYWERKQQEKVPGKIGRPRGSPNAYQLRRVVMTKITWKGYECHIRVSTTEHRFKDYIFVLYGSLPQPIATGRPNERENVEKIKYEAKVWMLHQVNKQERERETALSGQAERLV